MRRMVRGALTAGLLATLGIGLQGSSHREAPGITKTPKLDGTDLYMFRSYETGRSEYVTLLANYLGLEDPSAGPNHFMLDPDAIYEIHVDNSGDGREDLTFQFQFRIRRKDYTVTAGDRDVAVPLINVGPIGPGRNDTLNLNVEETYSLSLIRGARRTGQREVVTAVGNGSATFKKPVDRIGDKSVPAYNQYANDHIYDINIPGCGAGRVFVGQRREGFVINVTELLDLINTNQPGPENGEPNSLAGKNVTTLALEVPISCLVATDPVIGAWTTSSGDKGNPGASNGSTGPCPTQPASPQPGPGFVPTQDCKGWVPSNHPNARSAAAGTPPGQFTQASRLGHPLVNEVVIGLKDKDAFNASEPTGDTRFLDYVTHPSIPVLIQALFGVPPPPVPRNDLVQVFLTGIPGLTMPLTVTPAEMLRLNTTTAPAAPAAQNPFGVIGGDLAGFPNGRRPGDDVVDIELRVLEGILTSATPATFPKFTDGAFINATVAYDPVLGTVTADQSFRLFRDTFPYLTTPLSASPDPTHQ